MNSLSDITCLCIDYGNYFSFAERLGRIDGFKKVYYYVPYVHNGFPDHRPIEIGRNVPGVERVKEWASVIDEVDIVCFPDSHEPALQVYMESIGKKVFGCKYACDLEHDRCYAKQVMKEIGLPVNDYDIALGMTELDLMLRERDDVWIKSSLRGDMESFHHENYLLSRHELQRMKSALGTYQEKETYIIETPIESIAEIGIDTFSVSGQYPYESLTGIELKDTGYAGKICSYNNLPRQLRMVTDKFSDIFRDLRYNGAYSNEVIISTDKKGYLIDSTMRLPSPPSDLMFEMYENYPEVVWRVANGLIPNIKYRYQYGVQLIIKSELAKTDPSPLMVPDELKRFVKVKNLVIDDDGLWYYVPMGLSMCEMGSVIGMGNSIQEAISMAKRVAEGIKGFDIKINTDCIDAAMDQIRELKKIGINYLA